MTREETVSLPSLQHVSVDNEIFQLIKRPIGWKIWKQSCNYITKPQSHVHSVKQRNQTISKNREKKRKKTIYIAILVLKNGKENTMETSLQTIKEGGWGEAQDGADVSG